LKLFFAGFEGFLFFFKGLAYGELQCYGVGLWE
jgi:hypothetical protein